MFHLRYVSYAVLAVLGASWATGYALQAEDQPPDLFPLSDDFQVNTYTTGGQYNPDVAFYDEGFVVVWRSEGSPGTDTDGNSVQARRFEYSGDPLGSQFQVNVATSSNQGGARVAAWQDGRFVVVWSTLVDPKLLDFGVVGRLFASNGNPMGDEFLIASYTTGVERDPAVAINGEDFVVVWRSEGSYGDDPGLSIQLQRLDSAGTMLGEQMQVNTYTSFSQDSPQVASLPGNGFVVVWSEGDYLADYSFNVRGQRFDSTGSKAGTEFKVDETDSYLFDPDVAATADGEFMVVWSGQPPTGTDIDAIVGQVYDSSGATVGSNLQVDEKTLVNESGPSIAALSDGTFQVLWFGSDVAPSTDLEIVGRVVGTTGSALTSEFIVNSFTPSFQQRPRAAVGPSEQAVVVAWHSSASPGTDTDQRSIIMRRFRNAVFVDGFESGDTSAWSATVN